MRRKIGSNILRKHFVDKDQIVLMDDYATELKSCVINKILTVTARCTLYIDSGHVTKGD